MKLAPNRAKLVSSTVLRRRGKGEIEAYIRVTLGRTSNLVLAGVNSVVRGDGGAVIEFSSARHDVRDGNLDYAFSNLA